MGLNAHAQKKGCICNRLKFAMAAALWPAGSTALVANKKPGRMQG